MESPQKSVFFTFWLTVRCCCRRCWVWCWVRCMVWSWVWRREWCRVWRRVRCRVWRRRWVWRCWRRRWWVWRWVWRWMWRRVWRRRVWRCWMRRWRYVAWTDNSGSLMRSAVVKVGVETLVLGKGNSAVSTTLGFPDSTKWVLDTILFIFSA